MGNQKSKDDKEVQAVPLTNKIVLKLRYRDIILHYSFKMKVLVADIDIFPNTYEGLRLWDTDVVLSRFIILQNERFKDKDVMVFKAGVGIGGVALSKWGGAASITMCDFRQQVVNNMHKNCSINQVKNIKSILVNLGELDSYQKTYDVVVSSDLLGQGFSEINILNIWRKLLKIGGQAYIIVPDSKDKIKKFLDSVDRTEFKISNLILTADQYQLSPLFNKIQGVSEFPLIGKSIFYAISLTKLKEGNIQQQPNDQQPIINTKEERQAPVIEQKEGVKQEKVGKQKEIQKISTKEEEQVVEDKREILQVQKQAENEVQVNKENEIENNRQKLQVQEDGEKGDKTENVAEEVQKQSVETPQPVLFEDKNQKLAQKDKTTQTKQKQQPSEELYEKKEVLIQAGSEREQQNIEQSQAQEGVKVEEVEEVEEVKSESVKQEVEVPLSLMQNQIEQQVAKDSCQRQQQQKKEPQDVRVNKVKKGKHNKRRK